MAVGLLPSANGLTGCGAAMARKGLADWGAAAKGLPFAITASGAMPVSRM